MKSMKFFGTLILSFAFVMVTVVSCDKDIEISEQLTPQSPTNLDENAESWLPVNNDATDVTLTKITTAAETSTPKIFDPANDEAAVKNINSDAYKAELASIKDMQSKLTGEQRKIIEYWSGGGVL